MGTFEDELKKDSCKKTQMSLIKKILLIFFLLFPISKSFGDIYRVTEVTFNQKQTINTRGDEDAGTLSGDVDFGLAAGIEFNADGTKMFVSFAQTDTSESDLTRVINTYDLSTPYDVSTETFAGDSERCEFEVHTDDSGHQIYDLELSNDGMKMLLVTRVRSSSADHDKAYVFDLTTAYDISTCSLSSETTDIDSDTFTSGSNAGEHDGTTEHMLQGIEVNEDGSKVFLLFNNRNCNSGEAGARLYEYKLSTPYDLTTMSLVLNAGIRFDCLETGGVKNGAAMRFSPNGKRLFITNHDTQQRGVTQISLTSAYDTSSFKMDGRVVLGGAFDNMSDGNDQPRGIAFNLNGLKMYLTSDRTQGNKDEIYEYDLNCPFNIIEGNCSFTTNNSDRTAIIEAQIEIAKKTIDHSTDTALNRLKWIRRNKDKQNLTNLNLNINFTNQKLASLTEVIRTSAAKNKSKNEYKEEDLFYWSEGSIAVGRIGDTSISSTKKIGTDAITFGVDKFVKNNEIKGLAFRVGRNNVDVGSAGSNLDTDTYNITYYATSPIKNDTKFVDTIVGFGKIRSKYLTIANKINHTANRTGQQIYFTRKIKDEIKKNNFTIIPSGQFDFGQTILNGYSETGLTGITFEKQHVRTRNLRGAIAIVEDLSNENISFKRHGKLEYSADLSRSSNLEYRYNSGSDTIHTTLHSGSIHNLKGEIGIDIILPNNFSVFFIYERNQALDVGHTDKVHIAIGYLPNKETNYAFSIDGSDEFKSNYVLSKNINDYLIDFKLTNDLMNPKDYDEASFNLIRKF